MSAIDEAIANSANPVTAIAGDAVGIDAKVRALTSASMYCDNSKGIDVVETHFAWVFLTEHFAFKLKKPITADRLDQTTLDARFRACSEEVRLNLKLAPSVYLGIVSLNVAENGTLAIGGTGAVIDWLVKMRRLPSELMLDSAMISGAIKPTATDSIGRMLAEFYAKQTPKEFDAPEYRFRLRNQIDATHRELLAPDLGLSKSKVDTLHAAQILAFHVVSAELGARARQRRIVEAHGDLRPEHIYMGQPPCVIDSLEFSSDLRTLDPLEELAFLAVECAHAGNDAVGMAILQSYRRYSHDEFSTRLFDFYRSHRAAVRAKIVAWHLRDEGFRSRQSWSGIATEYVERATRYAAAV